MNKRYRFDSAIPSDTRQTDRVLDNQTRRVLGNTYFLLSLCLGFSALTATVAIVMQWPHPGFLMTLAGYFGLLFLVNRNRNNRLGIIFVLALTGFMGYTLGPIIGYYLRIAARERDCSHGFGGNLTDFYCHVGYRPVFTS